jgi:hypothetical protein
MIYIADLGRWVNVRNDTHLAGLLWTVQDIRPHAIKRAELILGTGIVKRSSTPDQHSFTYYFISPTAAASQFGHKLDANARFADFCARRDTLIYEHNLPTDWWNLERFATNDEKLPVASPMDSIDRPILAYKYCTFTGRLVPTPRILALIRERRLAAAIPAAPAVPVGPFVEDDA